MFSSRHFCILIILLLGYGMSATLCLGDDVNRVKLSLTLTEEYNDNIYETRTDHQADFITRVRPGFSLNHQASLWDWSVAYRLEYEHFSRGTHNDRLNHWLDTRGQIRLIDNFLLLDISDSYSVASLDDYAGSGTQNLFSRQTNQNLLTISPYFLFRPTAQMELKSGYRYQNQYYSRSEAIGWQRHALFVDGTYDLTPRSSALFGSEYGRTYPRSGADFDRLIVYGGYQYDYANQSHLALRGGYSLLNIKNGESRRAPYWSIELVHNFGRNTAMVTSGIAYQAEPANPLAENRYIRGRLQRNHHKGIMGIFAGYTRQWDGGSGDYSKSARDIGVDGTYEHNLNLSSHASITSTWYRDARLRPCRLAGNYGLTYTMPRDLSLAFNYELISNREKLSGGDATYTNRFILSVSKVW